MDMTRHNPTRVKVTTSIQRRRRWAPAEKKTLVDEPYDSGMSVSAVARKHATRPSQLFYWRRRMEEGALAGVESEERVIAESELKKTLDRIKRLERLLGQKTEEVECLKEAIRIGREKN